MKQFILSILVCISFVSQAQKISTYKSSAGKIGYKNDKGRIITPAKYDSAFSFQSNGYARVKSGKLEMWIDSTGKEGTIDPEILSGFEDFNFGGNDLEDLGKINIVCNNYVNAVYHGEATLGLADGYGICLFGDSSFYCGQVTLGSIRGNGILYDKASSTVYAGKWQNGKLTGDYYVIYPTADKVQVYSIFNDKAVYRLGMQIKGKFVITSNMINPFGTDKHNLINILDASTISTMYGSVDDNLLFHGNYASFDAQGELLKVNGSEHGVYTAQKSARNYSFSNAIPDAEKDLGFKIPSLLYPEKLITAYNKSLKYFGKVNGNVPDGFGSLSTQGGNNYLLSSVFSGGNPAGFKEEIINGGDTKYFYAGEFNSEYDDETVGHSGPNTVKCIEYPGGDASIDFGTLRISNKSEKLSHGMKIYLKQGSPSVSFLAEGPENNDMGKGFIMLPYSNTLYRGMIDIFNVKAEGAGETLINNQHGKSKWHEGKQVNVLDEVPSWQPVIFTDMFDKPFSLIK